jgi:hypothetical protein
MELQDIEKQLEPAKVLLAPLGEERVEKVLGWMRMEAASKPIVDFVTDKDGVQWRLGEASPTAEAYQIFSMFHWSSTRSVVVYELRVTPVTNSEMQIDFRREVVFNPELISGPVCNDGLFADMRTFLVDEDDVDSCVELLDRLAKANPKAAAALKKASELVVELTASKEEEEPEEEAAN